MANKKLPIVLVSVFLVMFLIISIGFFIVFGIPQSTVTFNNQCQLSSCPSGYTDEGTICIDLTCTKVCGKEIMGCGSYSDKTPITKTEIVNKDDKGRTIFTSSVTESSNLCYKFATATRFSITNRDPGGVLYAESRYHEVYSWEQSGLVGVNPMCSASSTITAETGFSSGKKGDGSSRRANGQYIGYSTNGCIAGGDSYGTEGELQVSLIYRTAPWKVISKDLQEVSCSYQCQTNSDCGVSETSEPYCDGTNIVKDVSSPRCQNFQCSTSDNTEIVEICNLGCSGSVCSFDDTGFFENLIDDLTGTETDTGTETESNVDLNDPSNEVDIWFILGNECKKGTSTTVLGIPKYLTLEECKSNLEVDDEEGISPFIWIAIGISVFLIFMVILLVVLGARRK